MKDTLLDLKTRRSIRSFKTEQIQEEVLKAILEAGMYAPTGMNVQSPLMVVVQEKEQIKKLSELNAKVMGTQTDPFYGAPTVVIVFADKNRRTYIEDGSLVMGNLMNAAHAWESDLVGYIEHEKCLNQRKEERLPENGEFQRIISG